MAPGWNGVITVACLPIKSKSFEMRAFVILKSMCS